MRKLNVKFFCVLVGCTASLAGGLFFVHRFQEDRIARALLYQAERSRDDGQVEKAVQFYGRYLEFKPDDMAVMLALGGLLERQMEKQPVWQRNPAQALYLYEQVLKHEPDRDELRRKVVDLYMLPRMRRHGDALTHLDVLQKKFAEDGGLWRRRAICEEALAQFDAAADAFQKAAQFPPDQVRSHELLARLLRKHLNRHKQADDTIQQMIEQHGGDPEAYLARARYRIEFTLGDVTADADQALKLAPENAEALLLAARSRQHENKVPEAIALLEKGQKLYPVDPRFYRHLAWIDYNLKKPDVARKRLQEGLVACPDAFELHTALAELLIQGKMFDQVQKIIAELKSKGVREDRIQYLTARIAVEREQWPEAVTILDKLRPDARGNTELSIQLNLLLAQCHRQLGDTEKQAESLKRVFEFDAQNLAARLGVATLHAAAGRYDDAIKDYQTLLAIPGAPETASTDLARLMIARKQRSAPEQQNWRDVELLLDAIAKRQPNSVELLLARADLLSAQKRTADAAQLLASASAKSNEIRLWLQAAHYAEQAEGNGPAVLDRAEQALGDQVELRLKRAAIMLNRSHAELLRALPGLEKPAASFTPDQIAQLRAGLGEMYFAVHDYGNAKRLFRQLAADRTGDLQSRLLLAEIALREKDRDAVPPLLVEIGKIEPPGGPLQPLLEARYHTFLAEEGEKAAAEKARSLLSTLAEKRPHSPQVHQAVAQLAEVDGDRARAIEEYRRAIELGDVDLRSRQRLVAMLVETQQSQAAEEVLQQALKGGALSPERQRQMLTTVSPLLNTPVLQKYVYQSLPKSAADPGERIWKGKMLWDLGDRARAIEEFRAASAQAGKVPENWVTLVQAFAASNQPDEARKAMDEARRQLPPDKVSATLAACLEITRQFDEAAAEYAAALRQQPGDGALMRRYARLLLRVGNTNQACDLLRQTLAAPGALSKDDVAWVRRHLAILETAERKPEQFARAFELLKQNEAETGETLEDLRAKVVLLAHAPPTTTASPRRQAVEVMEKIVKHPLALPQDRYSLAKLYDAEHDWERADAQYKAVIAADPKNPAAPTYYARRLIQLGHLDAAADPLAKLDKLNPTAPSTVALRSRWFFERGEVEHLLSYLVNYAGARDLKPADAAERAYQAGALLDEFARAASQPTAPQRLQAAAIEMYQRCVSFKPDAVVRAAGLLSHFGDMERALAWLETKEISKDVNMKASATLAALRAGHADVARCRQAEEWLREQARQYPNLDLTMHLADLMELQHRFDEAEALYRQVLQREPNHIVAMNNLAWVLANRKPTAEALDIAQRAIALAGPMPDLLDTRAKVYLALARAPEAVQDLEDAISEAPSAWRYFQLALAQEMNANPDGAKSAFAQARRHGIDVRDLHPADAKQYERLEKNHG